jgi:catechol 2,3-dioxygenase-like lactoylglutathione lyase family enzyme
VSLLTPLFDEAVGFYAGPWGLTIVARDDTSAYLRGTGREHHILELHAGSENALDHIAFALGTPEDVDMMAAWVQGEGVQVITPPGPLDEPGAGYGFRMLDPESRVLEFSANTHAVVELDQSAPVPRKAAHVVLNTVDIDAAVAFYGHVLGFRVSDWSEDRMVFMRATADHHIVAFNRAEWAAPNHIAYEVGDLDAFLRSMGRLKVAGYEPAWGPGRHGPGDNAFLYYVDPAGFVPEVTAEVIQVDEETWMPRVWQRTPELSDGFRTAGPPTPHVRQHMAGSPAPPSERLLG